MKTRDTGAVAHKTEKLTLSQYVAQGYKVITKAVYLNTKNVKLADVLVIKKGENAVFLPGVVADKNVPDTIHLTLDEYIRLGYEVVRDKVQLYTNEAGIGVANLVLVKKGQKPEYLKGVYAKDTNVPGGRRYRAGKTHEDGGEKTTEAKKAAQKKRAKSKSHEATTHHHGTGAGTTGQSSAEKARLGSGQTKKDHQ